MRLQLSILESNRSSHDDDTNQVVLAAHKDGTTTEMQLQPSEEIESKVKF